MPLQEFFIGERRCVVRNGALCQTACQPANGIIAQGDEIVFGERVSEQVVTNLHPQPKKGDVVIVLKDKTPILFSEQTITCVVGG